jgi:hypothetical protein
MATASASTSVFTVKRLCCKTPLEITISTIEIPANSVNERNDLINRINELKIYKQHSDWWKWCETSYKEYDFLSDNNVFIDTETDFTKYCTFDFDYSDTENPAQEKKISFILAEQLERIGLKRDKENPDIIIYLSTFVGKKEQYVPPTQELRTRYNTEYNIFTKKWETRQYVGTETRGGYTNTSFLHSLKVVFCDAEKLRTDTKSKVPPIIWQGEYEREFDDKNIEYVARVVFPEMIDAFFPIRFHFARYFIIRDGWNKTHIRRAYFCAGIFVDKNKPQMITFVAPNSPADKAGIKAGDEILRINNLKRNELEVGKNNFYNSKMLTYKIKRDGKKMDITLTPRLVVFS